MKSNRPPTLETPPNNIRYMIPRFREVAVAQVARCDSMAYTDSVVKEKLTYTEVSTMPDNEKLYDLIREDMRAAEERNRAMEERMDKRAAAMEAHSREVEARMDRRYDDVINAIKDAETRTTAAIKELKDDTTNAIKELKDDTTTTATELKADIRSISAEAKSTKQWIIGLSIATILGVGGMVMAVLLTLLQVLK